MLEKDDKERRCNPSKGIERDAIGDDNAGFIIVQRECIITLTRNDSSVVKEKVIFEPEGIRSS